MSLKIENDDTSFYQKYKGHINLSQEIYKYLLEQRSHNFPDEVRDIFTSIEKKQYTIAVLGKVKSGKSTFINALLQKQLLPTGALVNTH